MKIALDYDKTYTEAPQMWDEFIELAEKYGHEVFIATMRKPKEEITDVDARIVYTSRKAKSKCVTADIWIDDSPQYIYQDAF